MEPGEGTTDLFILPGFHFKVADLLVTNFHLPRSTLIALVAAFMGPEWRDVYATALRRGLPLPLLRRCDVGGETV